ncbi:hypothetical protein LINGRAHAP2_LOCUS17217 [Linum grandiflorum]
MLTSILHIQNLHLRLLCKSVLISGLVLLSYYAFWSDHATNSYVYRSSTSSYDHHISRSSIDDAGVSSPTSLSEIGFVIVSSADTWEQRRPYVELWWRPNVTRGYVFLDQEPENGSSNWPASSPTYRVAGDSAKLRNTYPNAGTVRTMRSLLDMYRASNNDDVRWFIMCDDDTFFFVDNLVEVLAKYDHTKYHYIGGQSECFHSNAVFSFDMGFGGAGYALSYPLVEVLAPTLDACVARYPNIYASDLMASSCLADIGVSLTVEKGFHQIDLHGDISGLLSSHPQSPALTLHHFHEINPIFPSKPNRFESLRHLTTSTNLDQSRILQQTICYATNFTFSLSWGYSVHLYETIVPRSILRKPLETFKPWFSEQPGYVFNTRWMLNNPCDTPHVFFFDDVVDGEGDHTTTYVRGFDRGLPTCPNTGSRSADRVGSVRVRSNFAAGRKMAGVIECCDVEYDGEADVAEMKLRACMKGEVIA